MSDTPKKDAEWLRPRCTCGRNCHEVASAARAAADGVQPEPARPSDSTLGLAVNALEAVAEDRREPTRYRDMYAAALKELSDFAALSVSQEEGT